MSNSHIIWSADNGWHDGPPAVTTLDDKGRLIIIPQED